MSYSAEQATEILRLKNMLASVAVASVRRELGRTETGVVAALLSEEPEAAFAIDYYFHLFEPELGAGFLNHPDFPVDALVDLFSCRAVAYHGQRSHTIEEDYKCDHFGGCWRLLERDRLGLLVRSLLERGMANAFGLVMLLGPRPPADLQYLSRRGYTNDTRILRVFQSAGEHIFDFIADNLDLYDYLQRLAQGEEEAEYLELLNRYFGIILNLRVAMDFIDDCYRLRGADGRLSLKELVKGVSHIPEESQEYTLHLLEDRGMIESTTLRAALDLN